MASRDGYTARQIALHWAIAALVGLTYIASDAMEDAFEAKVESGGAGAGGTPLHAWLGLAVLLLMMVRLTVRAADGAPPHDTGSPLLDRAAVWGHRVLYALLIVVPTGGFFVWFGGLEEAGDAHGALGTFLVIAALGHAAMALWHQFGRRDGTLSRMTRPRR